MKRTFKMKKLLLLLLLVLTSCSCTGDVIAYQDGFDITIPDEIRTHLINQFYPNLHFNYQGIINVASFSTKNKYLLSQNDNYQVSDAFSIHISQFGTNFINTYEQIQTLDEKKARFGSDLLPLDQGELSKEYMMVAWDENGTRYSYQFRTFLSGGKRYYTYCYNTNITIVLEIPLMVIKVGNNNKLVLMNLPYDARYEVHANLTIDALINKSTYLDEKYYTYFYPAYLHNLSQSEKEQAIWSWYETNANGYFENNCYYFSYFGETFELIFNQLKFDRTLNQEVPAFMIKYHSNKATL